MFRNTIYLLLIATFFACNDSVINNESKNENIIVHHTNPSIKDKRCIQIFDSSRAYAEIGDYKTALRLLHKCNEIEPNNGLILNALGTTYFGTGDSTSAIKYYFAAIGADSLTDEAYAGVGTLLQMQGKPKEAIDILKIGYSKSNSDQFTYYNICLTLAGAYYNLDSCAQTKKYLAIAKANGFNMAQFDARINQVEAEVSNYCK